MTRGVDSRGALTGGVYRRVCLFRGAATGGVYRCKSGDHQLAIALLKHLPAEVNTLLGSWRAYMELGECHGPPMPPPMARLGGMTLQRRAGKK